MKRNIILLVTMALALSSCGIFSKSNKNGCPSNGRNMGAEKLITDDPKAIKQSQKAGKFKYDKMEGTR